MANGEGTYWEGDVENEDGVTIEVTVSSPATGAVRVEIADDDTPESIARKLSEEWNSRKPIEDVVAVVEDSITAFFLIGDLAAQEASITSMAATFDGQGREVMANLDDWVNSYKNPTLTVTRGPVELV